jgi:thiol-disulfide isomerase/thioredoxin
MTYLLPPVLYLEPKDFKISKEKVSLKYFKDKTCVIMVQANYCGHCSTAKPHFQKFAEKNKSVVCLTIQGDDKESKALADLVMKIKPNFEGFPDYLLCKNGKFLEKEINGRTEASLEEFIK